MRAEMIISLAAMLLAVASAAWTLLPHKKKKSSPEDAENIYSSKKAERAAKTETSKKPKIDSETVEKALKSIDNYRKN